jgi:hypothetical protein
MVSFLAQCVRPGPFKIHYDSGDRRIRTVQPDTNALHTILVQRIALLLCIRESSGQYEDESIWIDSGLDRRLHCTGKDNVDADVCAFPFYLELFNFGGAAGSVLPSPVGA